ncbi:uncharacterized protein LOC104897027 [Beta vulgaris subsp. vulgaris]|uniref:uncharacterized protein LOC104897027 n=1 Tax=Beta vulgaris subsp. vulgaris TaxID=3555 RepID=UPI00254935E2|nr:uncharacterized protein LOC104897027 [Beta vulgaris subsp. vulgaris]
MVGRLIDIDVDSFTWYDACTFCGLDIQHVSEHMICSNCNKEKPPTTISVSGYMTIFDSTGTMRVKLFTKQIEFILHSTKAKLKHMFDAVHDRVLLRSELLTRVRNAYIFVFHPLHLSAYIVDYVIMSTGQRMCIFI